MALQKFDRCMLSQSSLLIPHGVRDCISDDNKASFPKAEPHL